MFQSIVFVLSRAISIHAKSIRVDSEASIIPLRFSFVDVLSEDISS